MANLNRANSKVSYKNKMDRLSTFGEGKDSFISPVTPIEMATADFIARIKENINKTDSVVTGKIEDISIDAQGDTVKIYAYPHLLYQSYGVSGTEVKYPNSPYSYTDKMPPPSVFKKWIEQKGIVVRYADSRAWAIAKSIYKKGFKPQNFYQKEIPKYLEDLQSEVGEYVANGFLQALDIEHIDLHLEG